MYVKNIKHNAIQQLNFQKYVVMFIFLVRAIILDYN